MRIINYKVKDYYDYLSGVYGIDNDITFDRKEPFIIHGNEMNYNQNLDMLFFKQKMRHEPLYYKNGKHIYSGLFNNKHCFVLEVGYKQYIFELTRYLKKDDTLYFEPKLLTILDDRKKYTDSVISFIPLRYHYDYRNTISFRKEEVINNPIIGDTYIPSFINAETIWNDIYNYLISIKEKPFVDSRTNNQKIESFGFDVKTSFRNPVHNANAKKK